MRPSPMRIKKLQKARIRRGATTVNFIFERSFVGGAEKSKLLWALWVGRKRRDSVMKNFEVYNKEWAKIVEFFKDDLDT
jgi:hypothetical protein